MLTLNRSIDPSATADEDDVFNTKSALTHLGYYQGPADSIADQAMIRAIKEFQANNDLIRDGVMKRDGPTIEKLNRTLAASGRNEPLEESPMDAKCAALESQIHNNLQSLAAADRLLRMKKNELKAAVDERAIAERDFARMSIAAPASMARDALGAALGGPIGAIVAGASSGMAGKAYTDGLIRLNNMKSKVSALENVVATVQTDKAGIEALIEDLRQDLARCRQQ
tara:strand:+ start:279 stop:956 length:678 start_codon:yes stop_codon:yes gene_type:complete